MLTIWGRNQHAASVYGSGDPATLWFAVMFSDPRDLDTGSDLDEPTHWTYKRVEIVNDNTMFSEPANGIVINEQDIIFPTASGDWGTVRAWALTTEETEGEILIWGRIQARVVTSGRTLRVPMGALSITIASFSSEEDTEFDEEIV